MQYGHSTRANTHVPALKHPIRLSFLVHLVPVPQSHQRSSRHVLLPNVPPKRPGSAFKVRINQEESTYSRVPEIEREEYDDDDDLVFKNPGSRL
jgi:hypothetical protein